MYFPKEITDIMTSYAKDLEEQERIQSWKDDHKLYFKIFNRLRNVFRGHPMYNWQSPPMRELHAYTLLMLQEMTQRKLEEVFYNRQQNTMFSDSGVYYILGICIRKRIATLSNNMDNNTTALSAIEQRLQQLEPS